ncbi:amidohydrolase family protein [Clostridium sp.]|uniref:amidohydrolase family protein n=1 Tax=Clostridium sp. TaxID=1506 RepID=UPI00262CFA4B|nr:amidohydrolase family protein [Clostridium sp.]
MIIDMHGHIAYHKLYPSEFLACLVKNIQLPNVGKLDTKIKNMFIENILKNSLNDMDCEKLIEQMNDAGIGKSVILILDLGYELGEAEMSIEQIHEFHYKILKANPDKFIIFSGIDPRRGKSGLDIFEKSIKEYRFSGLKLYPPCGYKLDDSILYPYYEICNQNKLPILIHTGNSFEILRNESIDIEAIRKISKIYSEAKFILAHAGVKEQETGIMLAKERENVYLDISSFQTEVDDENKLNNKLNILFNNIPNKILFGTDWPMFSFSGSQKKWVDYLTNNKITTDLNLEKLFYKNAKEVLNLVKV